ncbi:unnamed protein product [Darwinula stevensoni]|uniref:Uncharacterized protein n=1 Tax=Darwinula stevensoni TaxID=69355 RepID=A0A7R9FR56_9CRUS|nr:unnamed protein product [Darwinula stevensoni]CAG0901004.1 unnamed protein product [Darwinula stevensoni]
MWMTSLEGQLFQWNQQLYKMGNKHSKGGNWENVLYFIPESDKTSDITHNIAHEGLESWALELIDGSEEIENVWVYTQPPHEAQLTAGLLYHAFVVLQTNEWWWSVEKDTGGIFLQRSKKKEFVKEYFRMENREVPLSLEAGDRGRMKMEDLIHWLYKQREVRKGYRIDDRDMNCQGFAKRVFDEFAKSKFWELIIP